MYQRHKICTNSNLFFKQNHSQNFRNMSTVIYGALYIGPCTNCQYNAYDSIKNSWVHWYLDDFWWWVWADFHYTKFHFCFELQSEPYTSTLVLGFVAINYSCYAFGTVFAACELCEQAGYLFNEIDDIISQMDWYNFPDEIQKLLPTILNMAQKPFKIECFGSITCSRETFKKVRFVYWKIDYNVNHVHLQSLKLNFK